MLKRALRVLPGCCLLDMSSDALCGPSRARHPAVHRLASAAVQDAGNGSSNGSSDTPARPKKRPRRPETWKKNVAKTKRAKGEAYVSPASGKLVPARQTGPPCGCKRYRCFEQFSFQEKETLLEDFYRLGDKQLQDAHLFGLVHPGEVRQRRPRRSSGRTRSGERASLTRLIFVHA